MILPYLGESPTVPATCLVTPTAVLIGDVTIGESVSIWFGAILRGDINDIKIGAFSNIQDNSVIHVSPSLAGRQARGATIGEGSLVAAGAVIKQGQIIPPATLVAGNPGKIKRETTSQERQSFKEWAFHYWDYAKNYL